jgi:penicillin amidase
LNSPGIWYENHLEGGGLNVTGVSLPGVPMVIAGHNQKVAWGFTDSFADAQDLYEEHLRQGSDGGWEVEFRGEWQPAMSRTEVIKIKGGKQIEEEVITTRHGPVINSLFRGTFPDVPPMALRWTALEPGNSFKAIYQMNQARSCTEFHEALRQFDDPSQNVVYADVDGNIGYTLNGRVPIRSKGEGLVPAQGWTGEQEWLGFLPHEDHPHLFNPPRGYVATANNQIQREDFPHLISRDYVVSERIGRILEMIEACEKIDINYVEAMHYDQTAISSRLVGRALGGLAVDDPDLRPIVEAMQSWDGKLDKDDPLASIFEATVREAGRMMIDQHMGELGRRASGEDLLAGEWPSHLWEFFIRLMDQPDSPWFDLGHGEKRDDVLRLALRKALEYLKKELGPDMGRWKWGRLHQLTFNHILGNQKALARTFNLGPFPMGGDGNTIAASYTSYCSLDPCPMWGPPYRFIADLSDLDHCWGVLAPGQSGNLASRHYRDGIQPWFEGTYHPVLFRRDEVEARLEDRLELRPSAVPPAPERMDEK